MNTIKRIIAVIDPTKDDQHGLSRSIDLAKKSGASITAFMTVYDFSYEMTTMLSGDEREAMRDAVLKDRQLWLNDYGFIRTVMPNHLGVNIYIFVRRN